MDISQYLVFDTTMINIADSIREKTYSVNGYLPSQMANNINNIRIKPRQSFTEIDTFTIDPNGYLQEYVENFIIVNRLPQIFNESISDNCIGCGGYPTDVYLFYGKNTFLTTSESDINIIDMNYIFQGCKRLTMEPFCTGATRSMAYCYDNCQNLIGAPVCGPQVNEMQGAYRNCVNLTGEPVCGPHVKNLSETYAYCSNLSGNMYISYNEQEEVNGSNCFRGRDNNYRLNIFVKPNSQWNNWIYQNRSGHLGSITGTDIRWSNSDNCYYNLSSNIYIYYNYS